VLPTEHANGAPGDSKHSAARIVKPTGHAVQPSCEWMMSCEAH
jgi:hypothetical protein